VTDNDLQPGGTVNEERPTPGDPFLRALAEHWLEVLALASEENRRRLLDLATARDDPEDVRHLLVDLVLDVLPREHPLVEVIRRHVMSEHLHAGVLDDVASEFARFADVVSHLPELAALATRRDPDPDDPFHRAVLARLTGVPRLTADELRAAGITPSDSRLVRLPEGDRLLLPGFQFDTAGRPLAVALQVNALLDAANDPWGAACWWLLPHARLGMSPAELIGRDEPLLLAAARAVGED
jgi:hypothetical protein